MENGWLSSKAKYLCTICNENAKGLNPDNNEASASKKIKLNHVDEVVKDIESGNLPNETLVKLATALGGSQSIDFKQNASETSKIYKDNIRAFKPMTLDKTNVAIAFLVALVGLDMENAKKGRYLAFVAAIDCLLAASCAGTITPLFFALSVIIYFISGSKTIILYLSSILPTGCYTTVMNWFKEKTSTEVLCPSENDVITYVDNSQILARNWRVRFSAKALLSVITSVIHIHQKEVSRHQYSAELDPKSWLYSDLISKRQSIELINNFISECSDKFNKFRNNFILEKLDKVYMEHTGDNVIL